MCKRSIDQVCIFDLFSNHDIAAVDTFQVLITSAAMDEFDSEVKKRLWQANQQMYKRMLVMSESDDGRNGCCISGA